AGGVADCMGANGSTEDGDTPHYAWNAGWTEPESAPGKFVQSADCQRGAVRYRRRRRCYAPPCKGRCRDPRNWNNISHASPYRPYGQSRLAHGDRLDPKSYQTNQRLRPAKDGRAGQGRRAILWN